MKKIFIIIFFASIALQAAESTFVGNGGNASDIELAVSKSVVEEVLTRISLEPSIGDDICQCTGEYADYPSCKSLNKLNKAQVNFCTKFISERAPLLSKMLQNSEVTMQWTESALHVNENSKALPVDAMTSFPNKTIMINKSNYLNLEKDERNFLLAHEVFHLTTYNNQPIEDEQQIGPFNEKTGGRTLLNAVGAAVTMYAIKYRVGANRDSDLSRSRQDKKFWFSLEYSQFEAKEDLNTLYIPNRYKGASLSFQYAIVDKIFIGVYGSDYKAEDDFLGSINGKDHLQTVGIGAQYRYFPFDNLFSFSGQSFGTVGFRYDFMNSDFELTESNLKIKDKASTNYLTLDARYYIPLKFGFWLQAGASYNQPNYKYSQNIDAQFTKGRLYTNLGVSYAF